MEEPKRHRDVPKGAFFGRGQATRLTPIQTGWDRASSDRNHLGVNRRQGGQRVVRLGNRTPDNEIV